jgi:small subunit ribosomal protein S17
MGVAMAEKGRRTGAHKTGVVVSSKMDKTVVVRVDRTVNHRAYKRYVRLSAKFMAHDEKNSCKVGDVVEIVEARPLSARKRWRVRRVVRAAVAGFHDEAPDSASPVSGR